MKEKKTEKKITGPREKTAPEKYWQAMVNTYFVFYRRRYIDKDGFPLTPVWSPEKRGMESSGLKGVITRLRTIAEEKKIEWTEATAIAELHNFLQKAYNIPFIRKTMLCCVMNKFKDMIIASEYTPTMVEKVLAIWYQYFPEYTRDEERDKTAAQIIIGFLKQQYLQNNLQFEDESVTQSVRTIFHHIKNDEWWSKKSLRSVANNLQEFINKIKSEKKNGHRKENFGSDSKPTPSTNSSGNFGKL